MLMVVPLFSCSKHTPYALGHIKVPWSLTGKLLRRKMQSLQHWPARVVCKIKALKWKQTDLPCLWLASFTIVLSCHPWFNTYFFLQLCIWHQNRSSNSKNFLIPEICYFYLNAVINDLRWFEAFFIVLCEMLLFQASKPYKMEFKLN